MTNQDSLSAHRELFNQPETAHPESPINKQGSEYSEDSAREHIILSRSSKVPAGKSHISWVASNEDPFGDQSLSEREDTVPTNQVLDYIEQEILFEAPEGPITVIMSAN